MVAPREWGAHSQDLLLMEDLPIRVTDDGHTVIDKQNGRIVHYATAWKNRTAFEDWLVRVISTESRRI